MNTNIFTQGLANRARPLPECVDRALPFWSECFAQSERMVVTMCFQSNGRRSRQKEKGEYVQCYVRP
jgi:hypothetical protein